MSGWTVVDTATNKSLPVGGTQNSGTGVPYTAPVPWSQDPVQKMRVSTPQSLIDTDFEYGTQPTKWESISLQNSRQSVYTIAQQPRVVTAIIPTGNSVVVSMSSTTGFSVGSPIFVQNSLDPLLNGWWLVSAVSAGVSVTYIITTATANTTNQFSAAATYVYLGFFYSGCGIELTGTTAFTFSASSTITVTTTTAHGLSAGSLIYVIGTTGPSAATSVNAAQIVATVPTYNTFTFVNVNGTPSTTITNAAGQSNLFSRPAGYVEPRSFDGGVAFSAGASVPNSQLIRQTRRYFRYQSGKGIQFSTGSSFKPPLFVSSVGVALTTVTVTCRFNHNLVVGTQIQVSGLTQRVLDTTSAGRLNGTYTVASITSPTVFTYTIAANFPSGFVTGNNIRITPLSWYGSVSRLGFQDQQNGMFFEYDGQQLWVVLRNSINQINGSVSVTQGSTTVTGTQTAFATQLVPGQFIVIRGQTYRVIQIVSNSSLTISPEYRGATIANAIVSKTDDLRIPQSQWNLDKCNGTGPSGYNIDLTRMQMWYIDYSWYGAGFIRYGVRGVNGQITYCHQLQNNNVQFESFMRSGNMAAHYELSSLGPMTYPVQALSASSTTISADVVSLATTIPVSQTNVFNSGGGIAKMSNELIFYSGLSTTSGAGNLLNCTRGFNNTAADDQASGVTISPSSIQLADTTGFPPSGTLKVSTANGSTEYITYTGITSAGIAFNLTRAATGGSGTAQAFVAGVTVSAELSSPDAVPSLSHWGSSAIMDGRFDDDKSLIFNYGSTPLTTTTSITQLTPVLAIRVGPAVDNGTVGTLGQKEIINRMQLELFELGIYSSGPLLVNLVLNGITTGTYSGSFISPVTQGVGAITSSLAQVAPNTTNTVTVAGGESVAAAFTNTNGETTLDLSQVRDLGNSILGGGTSNTLPTTQAGLYPDGPDILYVCVTPLTATAITVNARLSWKEAQA
jgi:hypothetical protein